MQKIKEVAKIIYTCFFISLITPDKFIITTLKIFLFLLFLHQLDNALMFTILKLKSP